MGLLIRGKIFTGGFHGEHSTAIPVSKFIIYATHSAKYDSPSREMDLAFTQFDAVVDFFARIGGKEFIAVAEFLSESSQETVVATKLRDVF